MPCARPAQIEAGALRERYDAAIADMVSARREVEGLRGALSSMEAKVTDYQRRDADVRRGGKRGGWDADVRADGKRGGWGSDVRGDGRRGADVRRGRGSKGKLGCKCAWA